MNNNNEESEYLNQMIEDCLNIRLKNYQVNSILLFQFKIFY